jgi:sterol desaturase/sphingolipid hydroxylase (fatty acid hydroxylase superfamily)
MFIVYFLVWTLVIYWIHRLVHTIQFFSYFHKEHHRFVREHSISWHWSNIFLWNDNLKSTIDYWITEVLPTIIFSVITAQYWIICLFYLYAATVQERVEHNINFNWYPFYTSGKWHVLHHTKYPCNFGIITPLWDIVFNTNQKI